MNAHYFQHVPFEDLGSIRSWLLAAGYAITRTPFFESATLPRPDQIDLLVVLGGPMSVNDEAGIPGWRLKKNLSGTSSLPESRFWEIAWAPSSSPARWAQRFIQRRKGDRLVSRLRRGLRRRVRLFLSAIASGIPLARRNVRPAAAAIRIAQSDHCENQAFQWGRSVSACSFTWKRRPTPHGTLSRTAGRAGFSALSPKRKRNSVRRAQAISGHS
jgi:hypothetical protein